MSMKIKRLNDNATMPTKGSEYAAGWDLYATEDAVIEPAGTVLIGTGWAMQIPIGYFGAIFARSGLAVKEGLRPANCVGIIDSDYRGEIIVPLHNDSKEKKLISYGERVAQLIVQPYLISSLEEVNDISDTDRGNGGFGSTGSF